MNEDYLWDKSGQPDPQIQELEEILGTLRYQPKPLAIPRNLSIPRRRNYFPLLAIAATVLVALLATAIWLRVRTAEESSPQQANVVAPTVKEKPTPRDSVTREVKENSSPANKLTPRENTIAVNVRHRNRSSSSSLGKREREEALAVKEQLMFALRLASEKLNLAHRKTQNTTPANQIKNQHRVG